ncbi:hypothetical protein Xen7305DRAFT_00033430 [Xenococcus sp. PCC 7305]|nr:hypothetical protein Xen7305DRAFT_00033430 [Xenococcus sp. PCC 7305]
MQSNSKVILDSSALFLTGDSIWQEADLDVGLILII